MKGPVDLASDWLKRAAAHADASGDALLAVLRRIPQNLEICKIQISCLADSLLDRFSARHISRPLDFPLGRLVAKQICCLINFLPGKLFAR